METPVRRKQSIEWPVKKVRQITDRQDRGSVQTDTEAEKQAYQEEKRENPGG